MFHEDLQISFFRTLGSANIADVICVLVDPAINTYCILVRFFCWFSVTKNNSWLIMRDSASSFRSFCYTHSIPQFGSSMIIKWDLFLNNKCFCAVRVNSSHVIWIQRIIRHSDPYIRFDYVLFMLSFCHHFYRSLNPMMVALVRINGFFTSMTKQRKSDFSRPFQKFGSSSFRYSIWTYIWRLGSDFIIT